MKFNPNLKRFVRRVRFVRAWVGFGIGLAIGAVLAAIWSALDWMNVFYTEWLYMGVLVAACGVVGLLVGAIRRVPAKAMTDSIDRRADLKNRLSTANERAGETGTFDDALRADASGHLQGLKPAALYPIKLNRWHAGALVFSLMAACLFMLGNTPLLLSKEAKANRAKMQEQADKIEHVVKPLEKEAKQGEINADEKKLAEEMRKLSQDLHKARIDPEEALRRQNELSKQAEKLSEQRMDQSQKDMQTAEAAMQQMAKEEMEKKDQDKNDPMSPDSLQNQLKQDEQNQNTPESLNSLKQSLQGMQNNMQNPNLSDALKKELQKQMEQAQQSEKEAEDLQKQIDELNRQLQNKGLTQAQKDALMKKLAALQKKLQQSIAMTKAMQELMDKMMKDPLMKEILELAAKAQIVMQKGQQGNQQQKELSEKQLEEMQKQLDEWAKKMLKDDKAMKAMLEAIRDMLKNGKISLCNSSCNMSLFSIPIQLPIPGPPSKDMYFANTGFINKGSGEKSRGKTFMTSVTGQSRDVPGQNMYIEMRGPTGKGLRTSIPYQSVLPSYKHKADEAINRQEIPPEHQKRVKKYFESLGQG